MIARAEVHTAITGRLCLAGCVAADEEAAELIAAATTFDQLDTYVTRRESGEPLAWITGVLSFCGIELRVHRGTYVPRRQSEELALRAACLVGQGRAADLCTGIGAIARAIAVHAPGADVVGVDMDSGALRCAAENDVTVVLGDLAGPLTSDSFDVVTAVAPYVPASKLSLLPRDVLAYEPRLALDGGADGLDVVRRVIGGAARILRAGGWLVMELGADQDALVHHDLDAAGFTEQSSWHDDDGDLRGIMARWSR